MPRLSSFHCRSCWSSQALSYQTADTHVPDAISVAFALIHCALTIKPYTPARWVSSAALHLITAHSSPHVCLHLQQALCDISLLLTSHQITCTLISFKTNCLTVKKTTHTPIRNDEGQTDSRLKLCS